MMRSSKFKYIILLYLLAALIVPAFAFAQEEGEEDDLENEEYNCNSLVEGILGDINEWDELLELIDCDYFLSLGVGPGQLKQAWRVFNMIEPEPQPETFETIMEDLLAYKAADYGWGEIKHAVNYSTDEDSMKYILDDLRSGENPVGWGEIKKASALAEWESFDGTFEEAIDALNEFGGWGELKKELDYSGPPPWAKGGNGGDKFIPKDDDGDSLEGSGNGPPYGKAKGHGKNKDKGK